MELTRRDAVTALAAAATGSLAGCNAPTNRIDATGRDTETAAVDDHEVATLVAIAEVVYPSPVTGVEEFVRTYSVRRIRDDDAYAAGVAEAVDALDEYTAAFDDADYVALDADRRLEVLDVMSVDVVDPDPDGTRPQRVRHYLVNELLYAFYTSPTGARLAGLENPPGHPGGTQSYQEGPDE